MAPGSRFAAAVAASLALLLTTQPAIGQKQGGILRLYMIDSPASMSIHEESTVYSERPMMGVFNNLVMFDQHVRQNSLNSVVTDLAIRGSWNADGTNVTFPLQLDLNRHL